MPNIPKLKKVKLELWVPINGAPSIFNEDENIEDSEFATMSELKASTKFWKKEGYDVSKIVARIKKEPKLIAQALKDSQEEEE